ncbi:sugar phosphate isomerase/epimerase [Neobacillus drentensis]|uniref:sugar phosphate isomerase/epimerase family protein n=1 Tax=Neobacillus drentensis TaxID=220684 RepID=UPI002FFEC629
MSKIGLQMYSVGEVASKDFLGTIDKVGKMGYDGVQFAGFFDKPAKEVKRVLDANGMTAAGSHTGLEALLGDELGKTFEYNHEIGNNLIIVPYLGEELRRTEDDYKRLAETFTQVGEKCKQNGFIFAYHNHDFEFYKLKKELGFDLIFNNSDPNLVKIELDCYWVTYAGLDPKTYIEKYGSRVVSLHIKDVKEVDGQKRSIEIGKGELDIAGLVEAGKKVGTEWLIVEQEQFDGDPMESTAENVKALRAILQSK